MNREKNFLVIGVGLPRTGTMSTKHALEMILPGKCYHMMEAEKYQDEWIKIMNNQKTDEEFASHFITKGYVSAVDAPFAMCYDQALRSFPNAKVLLNERDPESWASSIKNTMIPNRATYKEFPLAIFVWLGVGMSYLNYNKFIHSKSLKNQKFNEMIKAVEKDKGAEYFDKWFDDVEAKVPQDKLLVYNVKEGWEPLCKFLGTPIPEHPFPRVNDANKFNETVNERRWRSWLLLYEFITIPALLYGFYICTGINN